MGHEQTVAWPAEFNVLPKEVFNRADVFEEELERIFYGPEWHPIAHVSEVPNKGDFKTFQIGKRPVLVVRGEDGRVRVFLNSCPHRGTMLETCAQGSRARFQCPYHRWTFHLNGPLIAAPGSDDFSPDFTKDDFGLKEIRSADAFGVVYATFSDDAPALDDYLGECMPHIAEICGGDGRLKLIGYQKVQYSTNWKEYSDNEAYHAPLLHAAFQLLKLGSTPGEGFMTVYGHKVTSSGLKEAGNSRYLSAPAIMTSKDPAREPRTMIVSTFPMTIFARHLDTINLRFAFPITPDLVEVHYAYFAHEDDDEELVRHRVWQSSNLLGPSGFISLEDGAVFSRIHGGSYSGGTVSFQKGFTGPIEAPYRMGKAEEVGNLVRWERYRKIMEFDRGH